MELSESLMNVQEEQKFFKSREHTHRDSKLSSHTPILSARGIFCTCVAAFSPWPLASRVHSTIVQQCILLNGLLGSRIPSSTLWYISTIPRHAGSSSISFSPPSPSSLDRTRFPLTLFALSIRLRPTPAPPCPRPPTPLWPHSQPQRRKAQMTVSNGFRSWKP